MARHGDDNIPASTLCVEDENALLWTGARKYMGRISKPHLCESKLNLPAFHHHPKQIPIQNKVEKLSHDATFFKIWQFCSQQILPKR